MAEDTRNEIRSRRLSTFDLQELTNALDEDAAEQAIGLALRYDFSRLQMSVLHSCRTGAHKVSTPQARHYRTHTGCFFIVEQFGSFQKCTSPH